MSGGLNNNVIDNYYCPSNVSAYCRGFGFVTFKSAESVKKVLDAHDESPISIDEKMVRKSSQIMLYKTYYSW